MKHLLISLLLMFTINGSYGQSGMLFDRYYISGSLSLGQQGRIFADSSAWLELGKDTSNRGIVFPRVLLDSIHTAKRALFVYDLKDSVLYHFDGNKRVRYMTYKDSTTIRQLFSNYRITDSIAEGINNKYYTDARTRDAISAGSGIGYNSSTGVVSNTGVLSVDGNAGAVDLSGTYFKQGGNSLAGAGTIGTTNNAGLNLITNNTTKFSISNAGRGLFSGSVVEDILTLSNDRTNKLIMGVARNGIFGSDNLAFIQFGVGTNEPAISAPQYAGGSQLNINKTDVLSITSNNSGVTPTELRGGLVTTNGGSVLAIGSRANSAGTGHTGTVGILNWLTIPWHLGTNSDIRPTSGNMEFNVFNIVPNINQTGTATGAVRAIYINPNLISAPNFRAIEIVQSSSTRLLTGILQSGGWLQNGGSPVGNVNSFAGRNVFGNVQTATGNLGLKWEYFGVNMTVGADIGVASGGNLYETNTRTANTDKAWCLRASAYNNTHVGLLGYQSSALGTELMIGQGTSWSSTAPGKISFLNTVSGTETRTVTIFNTGDVNIGTSNVDPGYKLQVQGTTKVDGAFETTATIKTAQPSASGASVVKLGKVITGATVSLQTDRFLEVEIDGIIRKLAIVD